MPKLITASINGCAMITFLRTSITKMKISPAINVLNQLTQGISLSICFFNLQDETNIDIANAERTATEAPAIPKKGTKEILKTKLSTALNKLIFAVVLKSAACGIIMAHNHPSGNLKPSEADKQLHYKIKNAAKLLDIAVLDNLIITNESYYSFNDKGI